MSGDLSEVSSAEPGLTLNPGLASACLEKPLEIMGPGVKGRPRLRQPKCPDATPSPGRESPRTHRVTDPRASKKDPWRPQVSSGSKVMDSNSWPYMSQELGSL